MSPTLQLVACIVMLIGLIVASARQPACFPLPDGKNQMPLTCAGNPRWKWQTISEMTARTGTTAELLSGLAAAILIAIWNALAALKKHRRALNWDMITATYAIGAVGFVGLTVWNLRVQSTVHTCFTSQTIIAVYIQIWELTEAHERSTWMWTPRLLLGVFALVYVVGFVAVDKPDPTGVQYFDFTHNWFAVGQYLFFAGYLSILALMAQMPQSAAGGVIVENTGGNTGGSQLHRPYRHLKFEL